MINWLKNLFGGKRSLENPAVPLWSPAATNYLGSPRSSSGVAIDRTTVLGYPAVWRALNLVSQKIGKLPLNVYKRNKQGGREIDFEHPASWLLSRRPSDLYTPFTFKSLLVVHALLHGNGYAWIVRNPQGRPTELVALNPETTGVMMDRGQLQYFVRLGASETRKILPENVLHVKGLSHDGLIGYSVIDTLRESFGIGLAAQRYGSVFFRNNGAPGPMILRFPNKLDIEQQKQLREQLDKVHGGLDNSHRPMILANGGDITSFKVDNETAQYLQTREFEVATGIANIFGIPANKLGVKVNSSYGALAVDEQSMLHDTIDPWLVAIEEECESKLLKESQMVRDSHFIEFDRRSLEQADYEKKSSTIISQLNGGLITYNQAAEAMNLPGIGPEGDRLRVPTTVTYLDLLGEDENDPTGEGDGDEPADDTPLSGDPEQPAEQPAGPVDGESPVNGDPVDGQQPVRALLSSVVRRYLTRLRKAADTASKRDDWQTWLGVGLDAHRGVLSESIAPVCRDADDVSTKLLDAVREELSAVTRDQVGKVLDRIDADDWSERILTQ